MARDLWMGKPGHSPLLALRVWRNAHEFDVTLTGGMQPWTSPELTLRANQLRRSKTRRRLADELTSIVVEMAAEPAALAIGSPAHRSFVRSTNLLLDLAVTISATACDDVEAIATASYLVRSVRSVVRTSPTMRTPAVDDAMALLRGIVRAS